MAAEALMPTATLGLDDRIRANYGSGRTLERILALAAAAGADPKHPCVEVLQRFDSLHLGGARASAALLDALALPPGARVLDIGSGIGGMARLLATRGATVEGIDLSEEFVAAVTELTRRAGVAGVAFRTGSATDLPFAADSFDAAVMLHVGMNVADKPRLFAEAARVLRPGGAFAVYDVMRTGPGTPDYPLPWAGTPGIAFEESANDYARHAAAAGLVERRRQDRLAEGVAFLQALREAGPGRGMPEDRLQNTLAALAGGILAPVEMIFRKPSPEERGGGPAVEGGLRDG